MIVIVIPSVTAALTTKHGLPFDLTSAHFPRKMRHFLQHRHNIMIVIGWSRKKRGGKKVAYSIRSIGLVLLFTNVLTHVVHYIRSTIHVNFDQ